MTAGATRGPAPEEFPPCGHRQMSLGFWDGEDPQTGRRVGGRLRCYSCDLKEGIEAGVTPERCRACRETPTLGTLDSLSPEMLDRALRLYCSAFEQWPKGVRTETGEWVQALGAIRAEVRERADQLQEQGELDPDRREEHLTGAAIVRGLILGWCLRDAMKEVAET